MKSYCLLLVVVCSVFAIHANADKLRAKNTVFTPTNYKIDFEDIAGVQARDVSVGPDGTLWYISTEKDNKNYNIYRLQSGSSTPEKVGGSAWFISVDKNGYPWVVTDNNNIFKIVDGNWNKVDGTAYEIDCAPDGNVFHVGTSSNLFMLNRGGKDWKKLSGNGIRLAGGRSQSAWHLNNDKNIYRTIPGDWEQVTGKATEISVGGNGLVWILTTDSAPNQFAVFDEFKQDWVKVPLAEHLSTTGQTFSNSKTVKIAVGPEGDLYGVREDSSVFRLRFNYTY